MKIWLQKNNTGILLPVRDEDEENLSKIKKGKIIEFEAKIKRNEKFLRKYFALLNIAYEVWEPGEISTRYGIPQKNRDAFRKYLTIKAGYFSVFHYPNGKFAIEADSIAFSNMSEETFEDLYSKTIDVILQDVLKNYTKADLDYHVQQVIGFV